MFPVLKTNLDNLEQTVHKTPICLIFLTRVFGKRLDGDSNTETSFARRDVMKEELSV